MAAARAGEAFDEVSGLPEARARGVSWFDHAVSYVDIKWPRAAAKSRKSIAEALTTVAVALLLPRRGRPDDALTRRALFGWAFNTARRTAGKPSDEVVEALAWVSGASRPVSSRRLLLNNPVDLVQWTAPDVAEAVDRRVVASPEEVRALLDAVRGQPRRGEYLVVFFGCLYYAGMRPQRSARHRDCPAPRARRGRAAQDLRQLHRRTGGGHQ